MKKINTKKFQLWRFQKDGCSTLLCLPNVMEEKRTKRKYLKGDLRDIYVPVYDSAQSFKEMQISYVSEETINNKAAKLHEQMSDLTLEECREVILLEARKDARRQAEERSKIISECEELEEDQPYFMVYSLTFEKGEKNEKGFPPPRDRQYLQVVAITTDEKVAEEIAGERYQIKRVEPKKLAQSDDQMQND